MASSTVRPGPPGNRLLASLPRKVYRRLLPLLEAFPLEYEAVLVQPGLPVRHVYFPDEGLVSVGAVMEGDCLADAGMVGREGVVGLSAFLGYERTPFRATVRVPGTARRMAAGALRAEARRDGALTAALHRYLGAVLTHLAQSAACNSCHPLGQRCCRWLLVARDRLGADEFPLTHKFLAVLLGVRRQGVTEVAGALQRAGLIRYRRGRVAILDRLGLQEASCRCYHVIREAFDLLNGEA